MRLLSFLSFLFLTTCASTADSRFTYEEVNGFQFLEVTPDNLIQLFKLSVEEEGAVLEGLGYGPTDVVYDYIKKPNIIGYDWQMVATRGVKSDVFTIVWASVKDNDRLANFRRLAAENPHMYNEKKDVYILTDEKDLYFAKIRDLIVGKEVSITLFPY